MSALGYCIYLWTQFTWVFSVWLPAWWRALNADMDYLRRFGG